MPRTTGAGPGLPTHPTRAATEKLHAPLDTANKEESDMGADLVVCVVYRAAPERRDMCVYSNGRRLRIGGMA
jgi:hypothetical protein